MPTAAEQTKVRRDHEARLVARNSRDMISAFENCADFAGDYPEDWDESEVFDYRLQQFARYVDQASDPEAFMRSQPGNASDLLWALG